MKKLKYNIPKVKQIASLWLLLSFIVMNATIAQTSIDKGDLKVDGNKYTVSSASHFDHRWEDKPMDFKLPKGASGYLYLRAEGADGGKVKGKSGDCKARGGEGATIMGSFPIGNGANMIPPGSTIRFLVGLQGENRTVSDIVSLGRDGAGGGGGTGILFKAPNQDNWTLLMVAGAGGGGVFAGGSGASSYWGFGAPIQDYSGLRGTITTDASDGGSTSSGGDWHGMGDGDSYLGPGGTEGLSGGTPDDDNGIVGYPGGGLFDGRSGDRPGQSGWIGARTGTSPNYSYDYSVEPIGGLGGNHSSNLTYVRTDGGWGFGGGGVGYGNGGGGGGGGYSGGGGGKDREGGGGGSYLSDLAVLSKKIARGATCSPGDGFVEYMLTQNPFLADISNIKLTSSPDKCVTNAGGKPNNGNNIQLFDCVTNRASQDWVFKDRQIRTLAYNNKCMDVKGGGTANGTNVRIWDCMDHKEQKWVYDGVTKQFRSFLNLNKCLDDAYGGRTTNGTNIQLWDCTQGGGKSDQWIATNAVTIDNPDVPKYIVPVKYPDKRAIQSINGAKWNSNIQLGAKTAGDNSEAFIFEDMQIKYGPSRDLCLGLENNSTAKETNIQLMGSASDHNSRKWIYDGQTKQIRSVADPNKCIEVETTGLYWEGCNLKLMDCDDHLRQQFDIVDK